MENLNAEQIIKALECCEHIQCQGEHCPYHPLNRCREQLRHDCYALIKQLTEENERLRGERAKFFEYKHGTLVRNALVLTKNKRELDKFFEAIKAGTVRKMQELIKERCIKGGIYPIFVARTIDQIAKEMVEGTNEKKLSGLGIGEYTFLSAHTVTSLLMRRITAYSAVRSTNG